MKVILNNNVQNLGAIGEIVRVKNGYARNFLIPRGLAVLANSRNQAELDHHLRLLEKKRVKILDEAKALAALIEKISVTVTKPVGEEEKIFGTVTTAELEELLASENIKVSKRDIHLTEEVKKVGVYAAEVKLHPEVTAKFKVWVVAS